MKADLSSFLIWLGIIVLFLIIIISCGIAFRKLPPSKNKKCAKECFTTCPDFTTLSNNSLVLKSCPDDFRIVQNELSNLYAKASANDLTNTPSICDNTSPSNSPLGSATGSPLGSATGSPLGSATGSPLGSPLGSVTGSPLGSVTGSPLGSATGSPLGSSEPKESNNPISLGSLKPLSQTCPSKYVEREASQVASATPPPTDCVGQYQQCGGPGWTGPTECCDSGFSCQENAEGTWAGCMQRTDFSDTPSDTSGCNPYLTVKGADCYNVWDTKTNKSVESDSTTNERLEIGTPNQGIGNYCSCNACVGPLDESDPGGGPEDPGKLDYRTNCTQNCVETEYPVHMCPRMMLGSSVMLAAEESDVILGEIPANTYHYAVAGHDATTLFGLYLDPVTADGKADTAETCGQCYELEFAADNTLPTNDNKPRSLIVQAFNTAAPSGTNCANWDIYMPTGGYGAFNSLIDDMADYPDMTSANPNAYFYKELPKITQRGQGKGVGIVNNEENAKLVDWIDDVDKSAWNQACDQYAKGKTPSLALPEGGSWENLCESESINTGQYYGGNEGGMRGSMAACGPEVTYGNCVYADGTQGEIHDGCCLPNIMNGCAQGQCMNYATYEGICEQIQHDNPEIEKMVQDSCKWVFENNYHWNYGLSRVRRVQCPLGLTKVTGYRKIIDECAEAEDPTGRIKALPRVTDSSRADDGWVTNEEVMNTGGCANHWGLGITTMEDGCKPTCSGLGARTEIGVRDGYNVMYSCDNYGNAFTE